MEVSLAQIASASRKTSSTDRVRGEGLQASTKTLDSSDSHSKGEPRGDVRGAPSEQGDASKGFDIITLITTKP
jgi:hypothetical protein